MGRVSIERDPERERRALGELDWAVRELERLREQERLMIAWRGELVAELSRLGVSNADVARRFGVSRESVRQWAVRGDRVG